MSNLRNGENHSIRLAGSEEIPGPNYDEWDCLEDLEAASLIENVGTGTNPAYRMLAAGLKTAAELINHLALGKPRNTFICRADWLKETDKNSPIPKNARIAAQKGDYHGASEASGQTA